MTTDGLKHLRFWPGGMNDLLRRVLNGRRTIRQAFDYMEQNFTGQSRKAFRHKAYEAQSADITIELEFLLWLRHAIKSGYGKDTNFERVFR